MMIADPDREDDEDVGEEGSCSPATLPSLFNTVGDSGPLLVTSRDELGNHCLAGVSIALYVLVTRIDVLLAIMNLEFKT